VIGLRLQRRDKRRVLLRTDWGAVEEYMEKEVEEGVTYTYVGEAYERLVELKKEKWDRQVVITGRSKPWWKKGTA